MSKRTSLVEIASLLGVKVSTARALIEEQASALGLTLQHGKRGRIFLSKEDASRLVSQLLSLRLTRSKESDVLIGVATPPTTTPERSSVAGAAPQTLLGPSATGEVSIPRRSLLIATGAGAVAAAASKLSQVWATLADTAGLTSWMRLGWDKSRYGVSIPDTTLESARTLFGIRQHHTSIVPAASNPAIRKRLMHITSPLRVGNPDELLHYFSKATVEGSAFLQPLLHDPVTKHLVGYQEVNEILQANTQAAIVALGTPTSNLLIRALMMYREFEDPSEGHEYQQNDIVDLPIRFELRRSRIASADNQRDAWYRPQSLSPTSDPELIPNWGLTTPEGELLLPATDGEGGLLEDFVVISSLPSILHPASAERGLPVVCIGGTHSIGTLAIKDVLESATILPDLQEELRSKGNPKFWQAVIRVELDPDSGAPAALFLERALVQPVHVDHKRLIDAAASLGMQGI